MDGLSLIDLIIIIGFMLAMLGVGLSYTRKIKDTEDFFIAGRSIGMFPMIATICATIIGGGALIGRGGMIYEQGLAGAWVAVPYFLGMLAFAAIAKRINQVGVQHGVTSIADLMEKRFGRTVKLVFAVLIAYTMMATVGSQISATATIISMVGEGWGISYELGALIATAIFILYTTASGLYGVVYTDVVQFLILLVGVYIILPVMLLNRTGGLTGLLEQVPDELLSGRPDSTLIGYFFTNLLFAFAGAEMWQRAFASRDKKVASRGTFWGTFTYGLTIFLTLMLALGARVLLPNLFEQFGTHDAAIPALVLHILPTGLAGLAVAAMLAVMMSSSDSYLLISTQTILSDIIGTFKKDMDHKTELKISRIVTPFLGLAALVIALYIHSAYQALMFAWTFYAASVGLPAFAALFWKRATKAGILAGVFAGFFGSIIWHLVGQPFGIADSLFGGILCAVSLVVVSLVTYPRQAYPRLEVVKDPKN